MGNSANKCSGCAGSWETWSVRRERRDMRGVVGQKAAKQLRAGARGLNANPGLGTGTFLARGCLGATGITPLPPFLPLFMESAHQAENGIRRGPHSRSSAFCTTSRRRSGKVPSRSTTLACDISVKGSTLQGALSGC